jgi:hypothetical protein
MILAQRSIAPIAITSAIEWDRRLGIGRGDP